MLIIELFQRENIARAAREKNHNSSMWMTNGNCIYCMHYWISRIRLVRVADAFLFFSIFVCFHLQICTYILFSFLEKKILWTQISKTLHKYRPTYVDNVFTRTRTDYFTEMHFEKPITFVVNSEKFRLN